MQYLQVSGVKCHLNPFRRSCESLSLGIQLHIYFYLTILSAWNIIRYLEANCMSVFLGNAALCPSHCETLCAQITKRKGTPYASAGLLALQLVFHPHKYSLASPHAAVIGNNSAMMAALTTIVKDAVKKPNVSNFCHCGCYFVFMRLPMVSHSLHYIFMTMGCLCPYWFCYVQVANVDACLALHILLEVNKHTRIPDDTIDLSTALCADSFISCKALQNQLFASYNPSSHITHGMNVLNCGAVVSMAAVVAAINTIAPPPKAVLSTHSVDVILFCLLFPGRDTSEMVGRIVNDLVFNVTGASLDLLKGLVQALHEASIDKESREKVKLENFRTTDASDGASTTPSFVNDRLHFGYVPASRLRTALLTVISNHAGSRDVSAWPHAMFLAGHPYVCDNSGDNAHSMLKIIRGRYNVTVEEFTGQLEQIVMWSVLNTESAVTRVAGSNLIALLYGYAHGTTAFELVALHDLQNILDRSIEGICSRLCRFSAEYLKKQYNISHCAYNICIVI
jgi:hypothetical protein